MAMSKKDYEMIAKTISTDILQHRDTEGFDSIQSRRIVSRLSSAFMADNPRFNPEKFTRACGF